MTGEEFHSVGDRSFERGSDVDVEMAAGIGAHLGVGRARCRRVREYGGRDGVVLGDREQDRRCDLVGVAARPVAADSKGDSGVGLIAPGVTRLWRCGCQARGANRAVDGLRASAVLDRDQPTGWELRSTRGSTLGPTTGGREKQIMTAMRTTDYLINAVFVLIVFRQARERELDRRSVIVPLAIIAYVAQLYVHSIPTAGNDLVLIAALGTVGLTLGVASGFATHVRAGENGLAVARVGWIAGALLIAGIGSRMVFAFALSHGARHAIASFSFAHQIGAAAWPVALVLMALLEVSTRIAIVQLRGRHAMQSTAATVAAAA